MTRVLGVDLASKAWADNGSAIVGFDSSTVLEVRPACIPWPQGRALTPQSLADAVVRFCQTEGIRAVSLDGPQGWRDPATPPELPGVGRRCEYEARTQGKTGYLQTYPHSQAGWIRFCIEVFAELLRQPGVVLADRSDVPSAALVALECFPTSTWRTAGLAPLPGKGARPPLEPYVERLSAAFALPHFAVESHDDLQAVVAALPAMALLGGPARSFARGVPSRMHGATRVEGLIWDAAPPGAPGRSAVRLQAPRTGRTPAPRTSPRQAANVSVRVTTKVLAQVNRTNDRRQAQIAVSGLPPATSLARVDRVLEVDGET